MAANVKLSKEVRYADLQKTLAEAGNEYKLQVRATSFSKPFYDSYGAYQGFHTNLVRLNLGRLGTAVLVEEYNIGPNSLIDEFKVVYGARRPKKVDRCLEGMAQRLGVQISIAKVSVSFE